MRATTHIVRGELDAAAPDCRAVLAAGELRAGSTCLAQVMGGRDPQRAATLVEAVLARDAEPDSRQRAWALAILADFEQRLGDPAGAARHLREALALVPWNDTYRVLLADALLEGKQANEVIAVLAEALPSSATLVQRARAQRILERRDELERTLVVLDEQLAVEARRGERIHLREEALLALYVRPDPRRALELATRNFGMQRESIDVRILARAARAANDLYGDRKSVV